MSWRRRNWMVKEDMDPLSDDRVLEMLPANKAGKRKFFFTVTTTDLILLHVWRGKG